MPSPEQGRSGIPDDVVPFGEVGVEFNPPLVPGFDIIEEVGRGGMGVVYKARQLSLNRPVALKMILAGSHAGASERERFRREAEAVAALQNPHIVQIFEIGEANGHLFLALELVDGGSLARHIVGTPWPAREAAELIEILARAVQFAHNHGIVHRDLKPGNILLAGGRPKPFAGKEAGAAVSTQVSSSGVVPVRIRPTPKITDFGLAKRLNDSANPDGTKSGVVMGTPSYIAPEQASGKSREVGPAADVYALGAILYELLTGRPPFTGETVLETVLQVLKDDPVPPKRLQPGIPRDLETICLKCLDKNPAKRYASADALADDLHRLLKGEPIKARPLTAWGRGLKWASRHPSLALLGTVTIAATLALVGGLSVAYAQVKDAVTQKENEAELARLARQKETTERLRAEGLAAENERGRKEADERNEELRREAEKTRRSAYALQLAQVAAMCERDPHRALGLLEDPARCPLDLRDFTWAYLHRLCQREERIYLEHANDPLHAVAYSPTGVFVATAGENGEIRVWDPRTGRTWLVLVGNTGRVRSLAFSPDGSAIASASADHSVRFWNIPVDMLALASKTLNVLTFLQKVIKPETVSPAITLEEAHSGEVNAVAFSPDGRYLVSGGDDGMLRWWDVWGWHPTTGDAALAGPAGAVAASWMHARQAPAPRPVWESRRPFEAHPRGVLSLAFDAAGTVLVTGGADRTVQVWAADGSKLLQTFSGFSEAVLGVAVTPDGKKVAAISNGNISTIRLLSVATGRDLRKFIGHTRSAFAVAISPDGELLASTGLDRTIRLWGVEDGLERGLLLGHDLRVNGLAFSPDRRTLLSASMDGSARLWHTTIQQSELAEVAHDLTPLSAAISASGTAFAAGDELGHIQVSRSDAIAERLAADGNRSPFQAISIPITSPADGAVRAVAVSEDGRLVLAATDHAIFAWQNLSGAGRPSPPITSLLRIPVALRVNQQVYGMAISPEGHRLATLDRQGVRLWNLDIIRGATDPLNRLLDPIGPGLIAAIPDARDLAVDWKGNRIALALGNGIRLIDLSGKVLTDRPSAHINKVEAVTLGGPDGNLLASADERGLVKVWRVMPGGDLLLQAELSGHTGPVDALAFSPDGRTLATGGYDRSVLLWDPVTGQERATLTGHTDRILSMQFLRDSSALITVGRDGIARRWRADSSMSPSGMAGRAIALKGGG